MNLEQQILETSHNISPDVIKLISTEIERNWKFILWGVGGVTSACTGGFFFLALWIRGLMGKISETKGLEKQVAKAVSILESIQTTLIGDMKDRGLITRHYDLEIKVDQIHQDLVDIKKELS